MVIKNAKIILENEVLDNASLRIVQDRIVEIGSSIEDGKEQLIYDANGDYLCPGFIDLHSHGCGGFDFMDGTAEDIISVAKAHCQHGVTTVLPTTVTSSLDDLFTFIDNMNSLKREGFLDGLYQNGSVISKMPGIHFEGPFLAPSQLGAQDGKYLKTPSKDLFMSLYDRCNGLMKRFSLAPELEGGMELIKSLSSLGVLISAAHTNATYDEISEAYDNGLSLLTHFYSAMSSISRKGGFRILGVIESGYLIDGLTIELIADGKHLPKELLELIFKCKSHDKIIACSDSMRGAGMPDGPSVMGPKNDGVPCIVEDGVAKVLDRSCFAGSVATGDVLARTLVKLVGLSFPEMSRILSLQPARLIGSDSDIGSIEVGKKADLIVFDEDIRIKDVFVNGVKLEK